MSGTLALSWGPSGGLYVHRHRACLGRVALTYVPHLEIDELMRSHADAHFSEVCWNRDHAACMLPGCECSCHA